MNPRSPNILYKYRGLSNFKNFVDIIINERLYAAKYDSLNDPMEGMYLMTDSLNTRLKEQLKDEKSQTLICSLSSDPTNILLWSHYAREHKGVAIGIEVLDNQPKQVIYNGLCEIDSLQNPTAEDILIHKHEVWEYEKEYRIFNNQHFVKIKPVELLCGSKMDNKTFGLVRDLCNKLNPELIIKRMKYNDAGELQINERTTTRGE